MGGMTINVREWNVGTVLRAEFAEPASIEPADKPRLKVILAEIRRIKERVAMGDNRIYSETLGCWVVVDVD